MFRFHELSAKTPHPFSLRSKIQDSLLTLLYPQTCELCGRSVEQRAHGSVCSDCWSTTALFNGSQTLCCKCGAFLKESPSTVETDCHRCADDAYDKAISIGPYEKALLVSILRLKRVPFVPRFLSELISQSSLDLKLPDDTIVMPVPLSERRRKERGYNQSELIAEIVERENGFHLDKHSLRRTAQTNKSRAGMDRKSRFESVRDSFAVVSPRLVRGRNILICDDVFTSGATISACAAALKNADAGSVTVLTIARAK